MPSVPSSSEKKDRVHSLLLWVRLSRHMANTSGNVLQQKRAHKSAGGPSGSSREGCGPQTECRYASTCVRPSTVRQSKSRKMRAVTSMGR